MSLIYIKVREKKLVIRKETLKNIMDYRAPGIFSRRNEAHRPEKTRNR